MRITLYFGIKCLPYSQRYIYLPYTIMWKRIDLKEWDKFWNLTVTSSERVYKSWDVLYRCICDCWKECEKDSYLMRKWKTVSCWCLESKNTKVDYKEYIHSTEWEEKRQDIFKYQNICQKCWTSYKLNIHHWTYKRLWNENLSDLFVMCSDCHKKFHDKFGVRGNMMKLTKKYLWLTRKQLKAKLPKIKKEKPVKPKKEYKRKFKNKIFDLDTHRAIEVLNILENLYIQWNCRFKNARELWINCDEWVKCQHFFLAYDQSYLYAIRNELENRK